MKIGDSWVTATEETSMNTATLARPWLKAYPAGVPADIDASQYPSLVALMEPPEDGDVPNEIDLPPTIIPSRTPPTDR